MSRNLEQVRQRLFPNGHSAEICSLGGQFHLRGSMIVTRQGNTTIVRYYLSSPAPRMTALRIHERKPMRTVTTNLCRISIRSAGGECEPSRTAGQGSRSASGAPPYRLLNTTARMAASD